MKIIVRPSLRLLAFLAVLLCALAALAGNVPANASSGETVSPDVTLASSYSMTFDNLTVGVTSTGSLTDTEADSGFSGQMTVNPPLYGTTEVSGMVSGDDITFSGDESGFGDENFTGTVSTVTGKMSGTYDDPDISQNGTWTATPLAKPELILAALGDSYSSGEGTGDYYAGTAGNCDRSPEAWAMQLSQYVTKFAVTMPEENLVACSGAVSSDLKSQDTVLSGLSPRPTLITITIGGNDPDLGFTTVLKACAVLGAGCTKAVEGVEARLPAEEKILEGDYKAVHAADPTAIILVVGYLELFDVDGTFSISSCPFVQQVRSALNMLVSHVDVTINDAVIGTDQANIRFVPDLGGLQYATHGLGSPESEWWLYPVSEPSNQQMAHPNALGQTAIAKVVAEYINSNL